MSQLQEIRKHTTPLQIRLSWLEHEIILRTPDFTFAFPRVQAVEEEYIVLEALLSRTDVPCSQHTAIDQLIAKVESVARPYR